MPRFFICVHFALCVLLESLSQTGVDFGSGLISFTSVWFANEEQPFLFHIVVWTSQWFIAWKTKFGGYIRDDSAVLAKMVQLFAYFLCFKIHACLETVASTVHVDAVESNNVEKVVIFLFSDVQFDLALWDDSIKCFDFLSVALEVLLSITAFTSKVAAIATHLPWLFNVFYSLLPRSVAFVTTRTEVVLSYWPISIYVAGSLPALSVWFGTSGDDCFEP